MRQTYGFSHRPVSKAEFAKANQAGLLFSLNRGEAQAK
jgi:hypothetical protein